MSIVLAIFEGALIVVAVLALLAGWCALVMARDE